VALPCSDDLWSQPGLRRLCLLLGWCVPALIALAVFGVGLGSAMMLGGAIPRRIARARSNRAGRRSPTR
jgi:hypothetical protein